MWLLSCNWFFLQLYNQRKGKVWFSSIWFPNVSLSKSYGPHSQFYIPTTQKCRHHKMGVSPTIIHQIFSLARDWSKRVMWLNMSQLKPGNIRGISEKSPILVLRKLSMDNKHNNLHSFLKYARIFAFGHYICSSNLSFLQASLSENCSLLGTDTRNVGGQNSEHI